jgi:hypothetical protein
LSPILGIIASQNYPRITNSYESIQTYTLGSSQSSVTFSSIPSTFKHLQIRAMARVTGAVVQSGTKLQFNSDTGANYSYHTLYGTGASAIAYGEANTNQSFMDKFAGASASSNVFGAIVCDILDYTSTDKFKTSRSLGGVDNNGSGVIHLASGAWRNTNAITSITLSPFDGSSYVQYSSFALYGVKG